MNRKTTPQRKTAAAGAAGRSTPGMDRLPGLDLHLVDLQTLIRVAELGTLSAAAQERNVPVSQISRAITRLENGFKVRLINRSTHGLSVTPEGELFLGHARRMVETLDDLSAELDTRSRSVSGLVRLSVSQIMGQLQVIPSLPELSRRYPELRVEIVANDSLIDLNTEGIDIAVRTAMLSNENLVARELGEYGRAVYASPGYLEVFGTPKTPDELRGHRCITLSTNNTLNKWRFKTGRKISEMSIEGFHRVNSTSMAMSMVKHGLGIARLNTSLVGPALEAGEIVKVLADFQDPTRFPIYGVMLPDRHRLPKTRACLEHLQKLFANIKND